MPVLMSYNMDKYKAASYGLRRVVKDAKRRYRDRVEVQMDSPTPDAFGKVYHGKPGQNRLNCEC